MDYYNPNREWEISDVHQNCYNILLRYNANSSNQHCILKYSIVIQRFSSMYYSSVIVPAVGTILFLSVSVYLYHTGNPSDSFLTVLTFLILVISLMRTLTFLMGRETSLRIILLCLFFVSELFYLQFIDTKIPNNGEHLVYIGKYLVVCQRITWCLLITLIIFYISVLLYRNSLMLTATALIICVISNELYKRGTEDFPRESPEWLKSVSTFLLNARPVVLLTNFNTQVGQLT